MSEITFLELRIFDSTARLGAHHLAAMFLQAGWRVNWMVNAVSVFNAVKPDGGRKEEFRYRIGRVSWKTEIARGLTEYIPISILPYKTGYPLFSARAMAHASRILSIPPLPLTRMWKPAVNGIVWLDYPEMWHIYERMPARLRIARIPDDFSFMREYRWIEKRIVEASDLIFVCSRFLLERMIARFPRRRERMHYLPNGVDFDHFARRRPEPVEYKRAAKPRAVFIGALDFWFDTELLRETASRMNDVSFIVIGPSRIPLDALKRLPNVHVLGPRRFEQIPAFLQHADVGIVPFRRNLPMVHSISPLKVYEYLACGIPTVATRWAELDRTAIPCARAATTEEFVSAIRDALACTPEQTRQLVGYAQANSWKQRFGEVLRHIGETTAMQTNRRQAGTGRDNATGNA